MQWRRERAGALNRYFITFQFERPAVAGDEGSSLSASALELDRRSMLRCAERRTPGSRLSAAPLQARRWARDRCPRRPARDPRGIQGSTPALWNATSGPSEFRRRPRPVTRANRACHYGSTVVARPRTTHHIRRSGNPVTPCAADSPATRRSGRRTLRPPGSDSRGRLRTLRRRNTHSAAAGATGSAGTAGVAPGVLSSVSAAAIGASPGSASPPVLPSSSSPRR